MGQIATTIPPNGIGKIKLNDFWKGALIAFGTSLLSGAYFLLTQDHFPNWVEFQPYLQAAVAAFIMYVLKNLGTNNVGEMLQKDKPIVHVDAADLQQLEAKAGANQN